MGFVNELQKFLFQMGFRRIKNNTKILWARESDHELALLEVVPELLPGQTRESVAEGEGQMRLIENQLMIQYQKKVDRLTLLIFGHLPDEAIVKEIVPYPDIWCLDRETGRILIYENQKTQFQGLKVPLEEFAAQYEKAERKARKTELQNLFTPVNTGLVFINLLVFAGLSFLGDVNDANFMAHHGAMVWQYVSVGREYYRLVTSMFLHFGAEHLLQNMLILAVIGCRLERIVGKGRYLGIYMISGVASSLASLFVTLRTAPYTVSAGASGAIFGVMGGLLFMILKDVLEKKRGSVKEIGLTGILFMIVSALSYGFATTGVDNAAHIGGLAAGFVVAGILTIRGYKTDKN